MQQNILCILDRNTVCDRNIEPTFIIDQVPIDKVTDEAIYRPVYHHTSYIHTYFTDHERICHLYQQLTSCCSGDAIKNWVMSCDLHCLPLFSSGGGDMFMLTCSWCLSLWVQPLKVPLRGECHLAVTSGMTAGGDGCYYLCVSCSQRISTDWLSGLHESRTPFLCHPVNGGSGLQNTQTPSAAPPTTVFPPPAPETLCFN